MSCTCSIDFDEEWIQEDCHWKLNRLIIFTFTTDDPTSEFHYGFGKDGNSRVQIPRNLITVKNDTYTYVLNLSEKLNTILLAPEDYLNAEKNYLTIEAIIAEEDGNIPSFFYKDYYLKLAPRTIPGMDITLEYITERPGEVECSCMDYWDDTSDDILKGYSVEMFHRPAGKSEFEKVGFLKWDEEKLKEDPYYHYIVKDTELEKSIKDYTPVEGETVYMNLLPGSELYLKQADFFRFSFNPKELGIKPGDEYEFRIYPYNVYCSHFTHDEDGNICGTDISALITNDGTLSSVRKVPKGIVRVKVGEDWKEGQVWVMKDGQWKEAEAVYVMNESTWKEAK